MTSFYPKSNIVSTLEYVEEAEVWWFIERDNGHELITHEIAVRAKDALLNTIFRESDQITTGALIYNQLTEAQLKSIGEAAERQPGDEFALVFAPEGDVKSESVHQFGAKTEVTYEVVKRNDKGAVLTATDFLALTIGRKLDEYALDVLSKVAAAGLSRETVVPTLSGNTTRDTAPATTSVGVIAQAVAAGEESDLALNYDTLILRPLDIAVLRMEERVTGISLLEDFGVTIKPSRSLEANTGYLIDSQRAGEVHWEDPLTSEIIDDKTRHVHVIQSWATPAAAITTPAGINKLVFEDL